MSEPTAAVPPEDPYFKKVVEFSLGSVSARFRVSQALFSSHAIDDGTRLLLRSLVSTRLPPAASILDLGCGYGPIGVMLNLLDPSRDVRMVDRDALAVSYAQQNAAINGFGEAIATSSLGYDDLGEQRFDLIAMNIPGKAGERVIEHLLLGAARHLRPDGLVAIVAVSPLAALVTRVLGEDPSIHMRYEKTTVDYVVAHYTFDEPPRRPQPANAFDAGVYDRDMTEFRGDEGNTLRTVYGLPEFDTPSFATQLLIDALTSQLPPRAERVVVLNPGQGHVAIALSEVTYAKEVLLAGRDLLALRATRRNLVDTGAEIERTALLHEPLFPKLDDGVDIVAGVLPDDAGLPAITATVERISRSLRPEGIALLTGSSTTVTRMLKYVRTLPRIRGEELRRRKGVAVFSMRRR